MSELELLLEIAENEAAVKAAAERVDLLRRRQAAAIRGRAGKESDVALLTAVETLSDELKNAMQSRVALIQAGRLLTSDLSRCRIAVKEAAREFRVEYSRSRMDAAQKRLKSAAIEVQALCVVAGRRVDDVSVMVRGLDYHSRVKAMQVEINESE